jgi:UPF0716 protein FxsA
VAVIFLLYVILEVAAVVAVASAIGFGWMLLALLVGAVAGSWLARREGRKAFQAMSTTVRSGGSPHAELTDGVLVSVGGVLIMLPGFVSDLIGFAFLLPPTRALLRRRWVSAIERRQPDLRTSRMRGRGTVVDGEVVDQPRAKDEAAPRIIELPPSI